MKYKYQFRFNTKNVRIITKWFSKHYESIVFRDIQKKYFSRLNGFSKPGFEYGAKSVVTSVFPKFFDKIDEFHNITPQNVKEADKTEVKVYASRKDVKQNVDWSVISKTYDYIFNNLFDEQYKFEKIESIQDCLDVLPKETSSCYPNYRKKGSKDEVSYINNCIRYFFSRNHLDEKLKFLYKYPTTIFHRFTPKMKLKGSMYKTKYKIRQIFGVPAFICALEVMYFKCFSENFKNKFREFHTIGLTRVEVGQRIGKVRDQAIKDKKFVICGDIKNCDKSIPARLHKFFYSMCLHGVEKPEDIKAILSISKYMTYTPMLSTVGEIKVSNGSTTTGSWLTSVFTTFVLIFSVFYSYQKMFDRFPKVNEFLVQGDDFILLVDEIDDFELLKNHISKFNLRLKLESALIVSGYDEIEFLGFKWDQKNSPGATEEWIASRILFPEKFSKIRGSDRIISRYLSIIFLLRNSQELFKRFLIYDKELNSRWISGNFTFKIFDYQGNAHENKYPISKFLELGWLLT